MNLLTAFLLVPFAGMIFIPFLKVNGKGIMTFLLLLINVFISGYFAFQSLMGESFNFILPGSFVTGPIPIRIDALSGWFMLIINLVYVTGSFYALFYLKAYREQRDNFSLHGISFLMQHAAIISICVIQNFGCFAFDLQVGLGRFLCLVS